MKWVYCFLSCNGLIINWLVINIEKKTGKLTWITTSFLIVMLLSMTMISSHWSYVMGWLQPFTTSTFWTFLLFYWGRRGRSGWIEKWRDMTRNHFWDTNTLISALRVDLPGGASCDDICITRASCCRSDMGAMTWDRGEPSGPRPDPRDRDVDSILRACPLP